MGIPVKCSNCDELFPDAVSLYEHLRTNHNMASNDAKEMVLEGIKNLREKNAEKTGIPVNSGRSINCPNCNELFPEATSLYTHLRKNHNMASNDAKEIVFTEIKNYKEKTMKEAKKKKFW
jgi:uncharacterized C2H2 Zn-finger protein